MLSNNYSFIKANNQHCIIAKEIIFSVLDEYGIGGFTHHTDTDLDDIELAYEKGFFGMIKNENGKMVGTFGLFPLSATSAEIRKMYLLPDARGNGIGKWMVKFLIEKAKELNFEKVELETASVLKEAIGLYEKIGFVEIKASNASPRCDRAFEMNILIIQ